MIASVSGRPSTRWDPSPAFLHLKIEGNSPESASLRSRQPGRWPLADVLDIAARYAPSMETFGQAACLDLSGTERAHGTYGEAGRRLQEDVRSETRMIVSCGIGTTRMIARMIARTVEAGELGILGPGREESFLRGRPVGDLPGVGPLVGPRLERLGVFTVEDLRDLPEQALWGLFGRALGHALWERAWGRDACVVSAREIPGTIRRATAFHHPILEQRELVAMLQYLCGTANREMRRLGLVCRTVSIRLLCGDGDECVRRDTFPLPTGGDGQIVARARMLFGQAHRRGSFLNGLAVELSDFSLDGSERPVAGGRTAMLRLLPRRADAGSSDKQTGQGDRHDHPAPGRLREAIQPGRRSR